MKLMQLTYWADFIKPLSPHDLTTFSNLKQTKESAQRPIWFITFGQS
jgi:hypothetical protein